MLKFQEPLFLIIIPIIIVITILQLRKKKSSGIGFSQLTILKLAAKRNKLTNLPYLLRTLSLIFLTLSLSGPIKENSIEDNNASGIDIIIALDVSGSMDGLDFSTKLKKQTRLDAVKVVVKEFIESRPNDRIGVVAFAGGPYLASPLTLDHGWLFKRLELLNTGMIEGGTAIGSAIASASNSLNRVESKSKIIILLTDGENNSGTIEPTQAAEAAAALDIKIYTVGAGKEGQAPYEVKGFFGSEIQYVDVKIDEEMLTNVATTTGGTYFRAKDIKSLKGVYDQINKMETTTRVANKSILYKYYFMIPLIIGLAFLILEIILTSSKLRRVY
ncbi:MAG: VWA domain-containing protein [Spirochaetaceae bacterium]